VGIAKVYPGVLYVSGLFLVGSAFVLFAGARNIESIEGHVEERHEDGSIDAVSAGHVEGELRRKEPHEHANYVVVDSSAVFDQEFEDVLDMLKGNEVYAPQSVIDEIDSDKDRLVKRAVKAETSQDPDYKAVRDEAREYLEKGPKHQMYLALTPIINARLKGEEIDFSRIDVNAYKRNMGLLGDLAKKGVIPTRKGDRVMLESAKAYLENHCKVSDPDVDVLATAIHLAREHPDSHVTIAAQDTDFRSAIEIIRKDNPLIGNRLEYDDNYI
jgi:hypothetical protein